MSVTMPETTDSFGKQSLVVLTARPADLAAITAAEIEAGENISCHVFGSWWPTAATEKVSRQRKMCQTKVTQKLGTSTWETPAFQYSYNPQTAPTPGGAGNEAYEALPEGSERYVVQRLGVDSMEPLGTGDAYRVFPLELGPQVDGESAEDAGGEIVINQETAFMPGFDGPVRGVIA